MRGLGPFDMSCVCVMVILSGAISFRGITLQVPAREEGVRKLRLSFVWFPRWGLPLIYLRSRYIGILRYLM